MFQQSHCKRTFICEKTHQDDGSRRTTAWDLSTFPFLDTRRWNPNPTMVLSKETSGARQRPILSRLHFTISWEWMVAVLLESIWIELILRRFSSHQCFQQVVRLRRWGIGTRIMAFTPAWPGWQISLQSRPKASWNILVLVWLSVISFQWVTEIKPMVTPFGSQFIIRAFNLSPASRLFKNCLTGTGADMLKSAGGIVWDLRDESNARDSVILQRHSASPPTSAHHTAVGPKD